MLKIENVSKFYQKADNTIRALEGVSLTVEAGEFVAIEGPSGSGKTTLLLTCGGLLTPNTGEVFIDGKNPYTFLHEEQACFRASKIGFVFQQFHLIPYLNVLQNVLVPSLAKPIENAEKRAMELIVHFGLGERINHIPAELSTGERQRTALARALLNSPKLLLADEPTGNLDRENSDAVLNYLADFAKAGGGVLIVTHDVNAVQHAQKTLHLRNGKLQGICREK